MMQGARPIIRFKDGCIEFTEEVPAKEDKMESNTFEYIKEKAIEIVKEYRYYIDLKLKEKQEKEIDDALHTSKINQLIEEYKDKLLSEIKYEYDIEIDKELLKGLYSRVKKPEEKLLKEKIEHEYAVEYDDIRTELNNIIDSFDLCETRDQIMEILKNADLVNDMGIVKRHEDVCGYLVD